MGAERDGGIDLFICGREGIRGLRLRGRRAQEVFRLNLAAAPGLSDAQRELMEWFNGGDEVKPLAGGRLLITSVGGCVAFLAAQARRLRVFAWADGVHSAEELPGGLVAVAVSHRTGRGAATDGHRLSLYDPRRPYAELWGEEFLSAHGVVWDGERSLLYALGHDELRAYRLDIQARRSPALAPADSWPLPSPDGHDLQPLPGSADLLLSVHAGVMLFDRETRRFRPHPVLGSTLKVKSVSVNPLSGRLAAIQAEGESNYANRLLLLEPDAEIEIPGPPIYKARWSLARESPSG